jgi:acyl-CoA synthetase (AMP-forming)/AMP-acid ligase II
MKTGACAVPLNFRFTKEDLIYCAEVSEPSIFILDEAFVESTDGIRQNLSESGISICIGHSARKDIENMEDFAANAQTDSPDIKIDDEDECGLYFTSGTTGAPKPVLAVHRNFFSHGITEAANHYLEYTDIFLMMPPMYHLAIGHVLGVVVVGGCTVLLTEKISPKFIFEALSKERISDLFLLVPWALDILRALDMKEIDLGDFNIDALKLIHMGAQPIPPSLIERLKEYFPSVKYDTSYGLSEATGPGIINLGFKNEDKIGSIGKPSIMCDARIVNEEKDVAVGEIGEIIIKSNHIMKEYYKNPELTGETIRNGWLYTGDLGRKDEDGFFYIVDRKKDLVISGGENIYPQEIEEILQQHEKIHDVAVIGTPDERLGEIVTAVIEPVFDMKLTEAEMNLYCEKNLPRYKRPRRIIFDRVPRGPTGKIQKPLLRTKYEKLKS